MPQGGTGSLEELQPSFIMSKTMAP